MRKLLLISLGFILLFSACENDLELNTEWKDITVVYGLLNQKDSVHYLKINKAYLGEGNALIMAQVADSSTYFNNLDVRIEEWKNGQYANKTIIFDTTTIYDKESGTFYYPKQLLYKSNTKLDSSKEYRLKITNKITGKVITAHTELLKNIYIIKPYRNPQNPLVNFTSKESISVQFKIDENGNSRYFQVYFRFHYTEQDKNTLITTKKFLDYYVGESVFDNVNSEISISFLGESFYSMLNSKISNNPNVIRKILPGEEIDLLIYAANDEFYTYMQAVKPSTGIVQEKPEFTNIENGIGIFASRYYIKAGYNLSPVSLDSLYYGRLTKDLGFVR